MNEAVARVFAVIPAAGQSQRMGRPKQLLPIGGRTMLESVIETVLAGEIDGLCVVTSSTIETELDLSDDPRFLTAINNDPRTQMLDSVLLGISTLRHSFELGPTDGILVCPGDAAGVSADDVQACAQAYRHEPGRFTVAAHAGRHGHPIVVPALLEAELRSMPEGGIKSLLARHWDTVRIVESSSAGVLADVDTPEDHARLMSKHQPT